MKTATRRICKPERYHKYRNEIKTGDLILFESKDPISKIISWRTKSAITHAAMAFWLMGPTGKTRLYIVEGVVFGVYPTYLSNRVAWYMPHGDIYWHRICKNYRHLGGDAADVLLDYVGTYYDFWDLIKQAFKRVTINPAKLFCSEAVTFAWQDLLGLPDDFIVPYPSEMTGPPLNVYKPKGEKIT